MGDFATLLNTRSDTGERARSAVRIVESTLHELSPDDLAAALAQANTKAKRNFLVEQGLPMRKTPDRALGQRLIAEMKGGDHSLLMAISDLVSGSIERRLEQASELMREEFPDDPADLVDIVGRALDDVPVAVLVMGAVPWFVRLEHCDEPHHFAIALHLIGVCEVDGWTADEGHLKDQLFLRSAKYSDDPELRLSQQLIHMVLRDRPIVLDALQSIADSVDGIVGGGSLVPIWDDLRLVETVAGAEAHAVELVRELAERELGEEIADDAGPEDLAAVVERIGLRSSIRSNALGVLTAMTGPPGLDLELNALRTSVTENQSLTEGLAALAAVISGTSTDRFADLSVFQHDHPEWPAVSLAAATGVLVVEPEHDSQEEKVVIAPEVASPKTNTENAELVPKTEDASRLRPPVDESATRPGVGAFRPNVDTSGLMDPRVAASLGVKPERPESLDMNAAPARPSVEPGLTAPSASSATEEPASPKVPADAPEEQDGRADPQEAPAAGKDLPVAPPEPPSDKEVSAADNRPSELLSSSKEATEVPSPDAAAQTVVAEDGARVDDHEQPEPIEVIERLAAAHRFGTAYWYSSQGAEVATTQALEFAAYAWSIQRAQDPAASEAALFAATIDPPSVSASPLALAIVVPSLLRAALATGQPSFNALTSRFAGHFSDRRGSDGLRVLASIPPGGFSQLEPTPLSEQTDDGDRTDLKEWAVEYVEKAPTRRIKYDLATRVFREFVKGGPIGECLHAMAVDDVRSLETVRTALGEFSSDRAADGLIQKIARQIKGVGKVPDIQAGALRKLRHEIADIRERTALWIAACETPSQNPDQPLLDRTTVGDALEAVAGLLEETLQDDSARTLAVRLLDDVVAGGQELARSSSAFARHEILYWELAAEPAIATDELTGEVDFGEIGTEVAESVLSGLSSEKLEELAERDDFERVELVLRCAAAAGQPIGDVARQRIENIIADRSADVVRDIDAVEVLLGQARVARTIDDSQGSQILAVLNSVGGPRTGTLGRHRRTLRRLRSELETALEEVVHERSQRVNERLDATEITDEQAQHLLSLIADYDIRTVDEMFSRLDEGVGLGTRQVQPYDFDAFFPDRVKAAASTPVGRAIQRAVIESKSVGVFDFSGLSPEASDLATRSFEAWSELVDLPAPERTDEALTAQLRPVLRAIGVEATQIARATGTPSGRGRHWFDLSGVTTFGRAMVPQMGSMLGDRIQLLVLYNVNAADRIVEILAEARSGLAYLVVVIGDVIKPDQRRAFANLCRRSNLVATLVDWPVLLELGCSSESKRYEQLVGLTLPFTWCNPYTPLNAGRVPVEMFYGRRREVDQLLDKNGPTFVYGGRQLGKSALLRRAQAAIGEREQDALGIYLDLNYHGVGLFQPPIHLWTVLLAALEEAGVVVEGRKRTFEEVEAAIKAWLDESPRRRLLILLDECDALLEQDWRDGYRIMQAVRGLMDLTDRRCKFVLAGLNLVQRFDRGVNQPLAHLTGGSIRIGPLETADAYQLVREPLNAIGIRFEHDSLAYKILAATNDQASIIQLVCSALVDDIGSRPLALGAPPITVRRAQIDELLANEQLRAEIKRRFEWTIGLDPRYQAIAYRVAAEQMDGESTVRAGDLLEACRADWPSAFSELSEEEFKWYLMEMEALGVLRTENERWFLRSPNVVELLGSASSVLEQLGAISELDFERRLDPVTMRYPLDDEGTPGPLFIDQLRTLSDPASPVTVVRASTLAGLDDLAAGVKRFCDDRGFDFSIRHPRSASDLPHRVTLREGRHRVSIADLTGLVAEQQQQLAELTISEMAGRTSGANVVLLVSAAESTWADSAGAQVMTLRKWDRRSLQGYFEGTNQAVDAEQLEGILDLSGGWYARLKIPIGSADTPGDLIETLASAAGSAKVRETYEQAGIPSIDAVLPIVGAALEFGGSFAPNDIDTVLELSEQAKRPSPDDARQTVSQLLLAGVFEEAGEEIRCDRLFALLTRTADGAS